MSPHYSPLISALVTLLLTLLLSLNKQGMIQDPLAETLQPADPIPRTGGIALMAGTLAGWMLMIKFWPWWLVLPALGLFVLSLLAEMRDLTLKTRLIGNALAAACVIFGAGIHWMWLLPVLLYIVWMTNLYNFMDGSDGLAGGMALFGFTFYGFAGLRHDDVVFALMNFSIGAAALGFLYHNFHPAKVYLGAAGAMPLGFLAAAFGVWGWQQGYWPCWFPILVFSPFVMDATVTLLKCVGNKGNPFEEHHSHYYQRLLQMGWSQHKTAIVEYVLMFLAGLSALIGIGLDGKVQGNLLAYWGAIYLGLSMWIDKRWRLHQAAGKESHVAE